MASGSQNMTTYLAKGVQKILTTNAINTDNLLYINTADTNITADMLGTTTSIAFTRASITGAYTTGHMVWLNAADIGTPFQLVVHDSSDLYLYKRWKSSGAWTDWTKMSAGHADTAAALESNAGGGEQPIYFTGGKPVATSYALKATVNAASVKNTFAYYSDTHAISSYPRIRNIGSARYPIDICVYNDAGNLISEMWYDAGSATNVTRGQWNFLSESPNSTNNTGTTGKYEYFYLPNVDTGRTTNVGYAIRTSKDNNYTVSNATTAASCTGNSYGLLSSNTSQAAESCYDGAPGLHFWRYNGSSGQSGGDGWIAQWSWNAGSVGGQIYLDDNPSYTIMIRGRNSDENHTFNAWKRIQLCDGTGASGTWGISITGKAGSVDWANTGHPSTFPPSSHTHYELATIGDKRNENTTPNTYADRLIFQGLKTNTKINSPYTDTYSYLVGLRGWGDSSGGNSHELAFNGNGIYRRQGATTAWGNWFHILDSNNYTSYTVTKTGSGASGTWGISISGNAATATTATSLNTHFTYKRVIAFPAASNPAAGWRRVCKVSARENYAHFMIGVNGGWNNGGPSNAIIACTTRHTGATLTLIACGFKGLITSVRLVNVSGNTFWVDAYMSAQSNAVADQTLEFWGNVSISEEQNSGAVFSTSVTAAASVDLTDVTGISLTSNNYTSYTVTKTGGGASGSWGINVTGSSSSCTGNAKTATTLQTARNINGTSFNGSANITTANWGTARNFTIKDYNSNNAGTAVSVNGSGAVTLLMPSTIYCSDVRSGNTRIVSDWIGFYQSANAGGNRYGYIECNVNRMYFRKENSSTQDHYFDFGSAMYVNGAIGCTGSITTNAALQTGSGITIRRDPSSGNCKIWFATNAAVNKWRIGVDGNDRFAISAYADGEGNYDFWVYNNGACYYKTSIGASSRYIKHNIHLLTMDTGNIIDRMEPVSFVFNNDPKETINLGFIYEDLVKILPEVCFHGEGEDNNLGINYSGIIPVLVKEIQSLRKRLATVETELNSYKSKI